MPGAYTARRDWRVVDTDLLSAWPGRPERLEDACARFQKRPLPTGLDLWCQSFEVELASVR